ncbi:hypothetical protein EV368DRAFT_81408 [Lentinula lateritia]|uniref:Uncharacterized protein n=1 Tax=Lentinula aff. lateritia TaxID=2804960 RepID=A0ACC1TR04_9AGAR|nr:hypothetical protein F5876DRAFT_80196 [Lentinula aff. lateritia]KAJ3853605.1 hypothetical protein EV368DRAFT_81408 [Lentinula lateritia]
MPLTFQDFSAWIEVDGSELPIFDVKENGKEVTCWIPSESDKNFSIKWSAGKRDTSMSGDINIDGQLLSGQAMRAGLPQTFTSNGVLTSATSERPFVFSRLELTDDDEYLNKVTAGLGDVQLVISHATFGLPNDHYSSHDPVGKVHEKSKKATGHKVGLGENKPIGHTKVLTTQRHAVIVTFVFKYRPIEMLRANGIAPPEAHKKRAASPSKLEVLDLTDDRPDSEDEEECRIKALRARFLSALPFSLSNIVQNRRSLKLLNESDGK